MSHPLRFPATPPRSASALDPRHEHGLDAVREAIARCEWDVAGAQVEASLAERRSALGCELAGVIAATRGDLDALRAAREEAFRLYSDDGDRRSAARLALALAFDHGWRCGDEAVGSGWLQRARRLLAGVERCEEHAWLALWEGHGAYFVHADREAARAHLVEGLALCREGQWPRIEAFGLALEGTILVAEGCLEQGMRQLDEAAAASVAGELADFEAAGQCCCCLLHACEEVGDCERALQWHRRIDDFSRRRGDVGALAHCRGHLARILVLRGSWREAETELEQMIEELGRFAPGGVGEGLVRLGELRRRQGRLGEAATIFAQAAAHPESTLGLAAVARDRGDAGEAVDLVARYFRRLPAGDALGRAPGLGLLVRAALALGRDAEASAAAAELESIATAIGTDLLLAQARAARAQVVGHAGAHEDARRDWEDAIDLFARAGTPLEEAHARAGLAEVLQASGRGERAAQESATAAAALARLGVRRVVALPLAGDDGAAAAPRDRAFDLLSPRQLDVLRLVAQGLSNREIGERLFVSEYTVKRHVADILARLDLPSRSAAAAWAAVRQCCN